MRWRTASGASRSAAQQPGDNDDAIADDLDMGKAASQGPRAGGPVAAPGSAPLEQDASSAVPRVVAASSADEQASDRPQPAAVSTGAIEGGATAAGASGRRQGRWSRRRAASRAKPRRKAPWWELPALVGLAIVIAVLVKSLLVQPFYIPSESMEKTLHGCPGCAGDRILVSKVVYDFRDPHPGDIVVFHAPNAGWTQEPSPQPPSNPVLRVVRGFGQLVGVVPPDGEVLVKRVVAVGGQTVKGTAAGVFVSDHGQRGPFRKLDETYVYESGPDGRRVFGPVTVPKGRLWVMGDHRDKSADSRYHCGPDSGDAPDDSTCDVRAATVPIGKVIGKAVLIAWPPSRWTTLGTPKTFDDSASALAADGVVPFAMVVPVFLVRRQRRRRPARTRQRRRDRARLP